MSNQSGIGGSAELLAAFPAFAASSDRAAVLRLDPAAECIELDTRITGDLSDLQKYLSESPAEAKYVALRLPSEESGDESLAFVQFMPDAAPLGSKMKYASSHATIHRQLGGSARFSTNILWTSLDEVSESGLAAHAAHEAAPPPQTEEEAQLASAQRTHGTRGSSVAGQSALAIGANVAPDAEKALKDLADDNTVIMSVNAEDNERIELIDAPSVADLADHFREESAALSEPRYVVAQLGGQTVVAVSCPREASIKQRMLVASTRLSFLDYVRSLRAVDHQVETFEPAKDLTETELRREVGINQGNSEQKEPASSSKPRFSRPRPPKRR